MTALRRNAPIIAVLAVLLALPLAVAWIGSALLGWIAIAIAVPVSFAVAFVVAWIFEEVWR